ncbi:MAG TPA: terminase gpA endonuclease subunit [Pirellulales bacterium]
MPANCVGVSVGVDTNKRQLHWTAMAWLESGAGFVIDYGIQATDADRIGIKAGLVKALTELKAILETGWQEQNSGVKKAPSQVWIDSGWYEHTDGVFEFCHLANQGIRAGAERYRPSKGYGTGQRRMESYSVPKKLGSEIRYIGNNYHLAYSQRGRLLLAHVNADHWKSELHQRLAMPADSQLAIVLFEADAKQHTLFAEQLIAEKQIEKYVEGRGDSVVWERVNRDNHFLDSSYSAVAAGDLILGASFNRKRTLKRMTLAEMAAATAGRPTPQQLIDRRNKGA